MYSERMTRAGQRAEAQVERGGGSTNHMRNSFGGTPKSRLVRFSLALRDRGLNANGLRRASCAVQTAPPPPPVRPYLIPIPTTVRLLSPCKLPVAAEPHRFLELRNATCQRVS
jgi:hypothetical protein